MTPSTSLLSSSIARALPITSSGKTDCDPFSKTPSWRYASDSQAAVGGLENYVQCGTVRFYPTDPTPLSTAPYTITWLPAQGKPVTVNVPTSALNQGGVSFIYNSTIPFAAGTQFQM